MRNLFSLATAMVFAGVLLGGVYVGGNYILTGDHGLQMPNKAQPAEAVAEAAPVADPAPAVPEVVAEPVIAAAPSELLEQPQELIEEVKEAAAPVVEAVAETVEAVETAVAEVAAEMPTEAPAEIAPEVPAEPAVATEATQEVAAATEEVIAQTEETVAEATPEVAQEMAATPPAEEAVAEAVPAQPAPAAEPTPAEQPAVASIARDAKAGKKVFNKCKACHTFKQGGKNRVGPNLWGIYNAPIMQKADFKYSKSFQDKAGMVWNDANLDGYLANPKGFIPKNKMAFAGLKKEQDRTNLIEWLKTLK